MSLPSTKAICLKYIYIINWKFRMLLFVINFIKLQNARYWTQIREKCEDKSIRRKSKRVQLKSTTAGGFRNAYLRYS
jgi:hypothetical protein